MTTLTEQQVEAVRKRINSGGVTTPELVEDLLDHLCTSIEIEIEHGLSFDEAISKLFDQLLDDELRLTEMKTREITSDTRGVRNLIILTAIAVLTFGVLIGRPVPIPDEEECLRLTGTVAEIYEAGTKDVVFKLQGIDQKFYVNRGLERGLDLTKLRADLINREILILYPKYWTLLNPVNSIQHISKIKYHEETIFTEID